MSRVIYRATNKQITSAICDSLHKKPKLCDVNQAINILLLVIHFFGPTNFHQGRQLFEVVGPDVQQLFWLSR